MVYMQTTRLSDMESLDPQISQVSEAIMMLVIPNEIGVWLWMHSIVFLHDVCLLNLLVSINSLFTDKRNYNHECPAWTRNCSSSFELDESDEQGPEWRPDRDNLNYQVWVFDDS